MKILGFYIGGHDSNVSLADTNGSVKYYKLERITQSKHKKGNLQWVKDVCEENHFIPDYVCFSDGNRNNLGICEEGILWQECEPFCIFPDAKTFCIDHHYAHILSAFPVVNDDIGVGVCVDGRGDHQVKCSVISTPFNVYKSKIIYSGKEDSFCLMFNKIGKLMGLSGGELDFAGKIMGAHAYGNVEYEFVSEIEEYALKYGIDETLQMNYKGKKIEDICKKMDQRFFDWLATYHYWVGSRIFNIIYNTVDQKVPIVYSGGGAQNTVYNNYMSGYFDMKIPPHCYDGGISLGCIKFLGEYTGINISIDEFPFCQGDEDLGYASEAIIDKVTKLLAQGKIVGWCQGKSEIGPRALGHRSILMDPSIKDGKDIMNQRIKKREKWRPFAASILKQDVEKIIGRNMSLDYMLHAVEVLQEHREKFCSVTHVDGTCRFQTVENTRELHTFYQLIKKFKDETGVYGILNTSYNSSGMPIANSKKDVLKAFEILDLDAVCIGNELIIRK